MLPADREYWLPGIARTRSCRRSHSATRRCTSLKRSVADRSPFAAACVDTSSKRVRYRPASAAGGKPDYLTVTGVGFQTEQETIARPTRACVPPGGRMVRSYRRAETQGRAVEPLSSLCIRLRIATIRQYFSGATVLQNAGKDSSVSLLRHVLRQR